MPSQDNILQRIAAHARERVRLLREQGAEAEIVERARAAACDAGALPFEEALRAPGMSFICECKKASPSKGLIAPDFDPVAIAREYEAAGAAAISCLTEPRWFQGSDAYLADVSAAVGIPVLRKDFVVDELMVYQAKCLRTFTVDFGRSIELRKLVGPERVFVSESGVQTREDIVRLEEAGVDAVLIGETLMRQPDKRAALDELRGLS